MAGPHSGTGGDQGCRAVQEQSRGPRPPRSTRDSMALGVEPIASNSKAKLGSRGSLLPGSVTLRQPVSSGDPQHCPCHPPPTVRDPPAQPNRGAFLVLCLCFLFSAFVLPSLVLCSSLSFVPAPLVSHPFDALSLPSSWCFSFPGFLSWRLFSLAALCLAFLSFLLPGPLLGSHGLSSNPHLSCFGAWIFLPLCPFLRDS